jgi:hypothetical protein
MTSIRRPEGLHPDWKKIMTEAAMRAGLVCSNYTGVVELSVNQGGVSSATQKVTHR